MRVEVFKKERRFKYLNRLSFYSGQHFTFTRCVSCR